MRRLVWGVATVGMTLAALAFTVTRRPDSGAQVLSSLLGVDGGGAGQTAAEDTSVITRRLYEGPERDTWGTDLSPDGRYLTQTDWDTGDLAVFDLLTGGLRRVTNKGTWEDSSAYAEMSVYSPDGSEIAYLWFREDLQYEIRVIGADGSDPHVVLPPDPVRWDWPGLMDWSPDGEYLLLSLYHGLAMQLALASVRDGSLRVLLEPPFGMAIDFAAFSPDGRSIAFDQYSTPASGEDMTPDFDVNLIPVGGGEPVPLLRGPARDELLGWEPDGQSIMFKSDRGLTEGVWRLPVINGRAAGEPELIKGDLWRLQRIGMAAGKVYYGLRTDLPQLYTAGVDIPNGRIVSPPTPVEEAPERLVVAPAWSPDGRQLAYARGRTPMANSNVRELVIRSLPGGPPRIIPLPLRVAQRVWWASDGRSLILGSPSESWDHPGWRGLFRLDLETGGCSPMETARDVPWWAALTRDLKTAYYDGRNVLRFAQREGEPDALMARDLETGEEREVVRLDSRGPGTGFPVLSPDEKWIARVNFPSDSRDAWSIDVVSTESGEVREVVRYSPPTRRCGGLNWSPDGRYLVFATGKAGAESCTLQRVPVAGGEPTRIGQLPSFHQSWERLNPAGTRLAFIHGAWRGEIWVMEMVEQTGGGA
jgi:Tol biopolymer transport system component